MRAAAAPPVRARRAGLHLPTQALLAALLLASAAAAAARPHHAGLQQHKHFPRMDPEQQKLQSIQQETENPSASPKKHSSSSSSKQQAHTSQGAAPGPLLPSCVPKYVTDLVIPPPMPVSVVPMSQEEQQRLSRDAAMQTYDDVGVSSDTSSDTSDTAAAAAAAAAVELLMSPVSEYEPPTHVNLAAAAGMTAQQRAQLRKQFTADQEYYSAWYDAEAYTPRQRKSRKQQQQQQQDSSSADSNDQQQQQQEQSDASDDPTAEQVPPPQPLFHSYDVSVRQIQQTILPAAPIPGPGCPAAFAPTTVLAYGPANVAGTPFHNTPAFTVEAQRNVPTHIKWTNDLKDAAGNYLPHPLRDSIDQTIHWANPAALGGSVDSNPCHMCSLPTLFTCPTDPACVTAATTTYTGPIPTVTHVHGQTDVYDWTDGYTEAWFLPAANNLAGFAPVGSWYNQFASEYTAVTGQTWAPGSSTGIYRNTQRAAGLWLHDHTLGLTRTNVYAGMAGFYFIRDKFPSIANGPELPGLPYPAYDGIIPLDLVRELPLAIQDRSFTSDSQLWYPVAAHPAGTTLPNSPLHPRWIPEYSATVADPVTGLRTNMVMFMVNGRTYPRHIVYPDAYRLRILNGCNSRTLQLRFARSSKAVINPLLTADTATLLPFWVVGSDDGFWPSLSTPLTTLQMGPAERYDVVIDFSGLTPGEFVYMLNNGPETDTAIYDGTNNGLGLTVNTAQIMRFDVQPLPLGATAHPFNLQAQEALNSALAADFAATYTPVVTPTTPARQVSLLENLDAATGFPLEVLLGTATNNANGLNTAAPQLWMDPVTADSPTNAVSVWDIINLSADSHPIHLHNVDFEYLGRFALTPDPLNPNAYTKTNTPVPNQDLDQLLVVPCTPTPLNPSGRCPVAKDTQLLLPGTYTRIQFRAAAASGLYVWHCHLVEHEDNEMMHPHCFGTVNYLNPKTGLPMCPPGPNAADDSDSSSPSPLKHTSHSKGSSKSSTAAAKKAKKVSSWADLDF